MNEITTDNDKQLFDYLVELLSKEVTLYRQLLEMLRNKQEAIVIGDVKTLRKCVVEEQLLIQKIKSLAKIRSEHVVTISWTYKLAEKEPKLKTIMEIAPAEFSISFINLRYQLKTILDEITNINRENSYLLNFSIEHIKGLAHLFLRTDNESSEIYDVNGIVITPEDGNKVLNFQI
ncbi:MAG: hypothetical protein DRP89_06175 [Candidatus Neomarinimicrobiota bacterium]|nr:MAG: hypothetical protein DRP89_06175 [Candidatus Neomarinimicrobiota bacterium]